MSFQTRHSFSAPPEVVFGTLTDPSGLYRWLPDELRQRASDHRVSIDPDQFRVVWRPEDGTGWRGSLDVHDSGAGASEAAVDLDAEGVSDDQRRQVEGLVDDALTALDREIEDRFNAG